MNVSDLDIPGVDPQKPPKPPPRFFLAHPKSYGDEDLKRWGNAAALLLNRLGGGKPYALVLGRDHHAARFKACGSWESWALEVATGIDYLTRQPTFTAILVPADAVGAGTAKLLEFALGGRRPCYTFDVKARWAIVVGIKQVSPSWQNGWKMQIDRALHE